jgi:PPOX class probable F420-dependent enzyme
LDRLSDRARALLESDAVATVVTINSDGSPHVTAAWVGIDGGEIVFATIPDQRKLRNLRRDPRVVLSMLGTNVNEWGLREYLVIEGKARITDGGASKVRDRATPTPEPIARVAEVMRSFDARWFVSGGWAVDCWLGRQTREHADVDIGLFRDSESAIFEFLPGWHLVGHDTPDATHDEPSPPTAATRSIRRRRGRGRRASVTESRCLRVLV